MWHAIILGEPASKANSRRIVLRGSRPAVIKSAKALSYADAFRLQARPLKTLLTTDVWVCAHIHYASRRPDLDESLVLDLLQGVVYANDRQVKLKVMRWGLDRESPHIELWVGTLEEQEELHKCMKSLSSSSLLFFSREKKRREEEES